MRKSSSICNLRIQLFAILLSVVASNVSAELLTPAGARVRAIGESSRAGTNVEDYTLSHTALSESGTPGAYIFSRSAGGYVIVSADDVATPLLGYSNEGSFSKESMPEAMKWWLDGISNMIAEASSSGLTHSQATLGTSLNRPAIPPYCTAKWDQGAPFNNLCPVIDGYRCPTGCVATAMSQILYSMKYPETTCGVADYYLGETRMTMDLEGMSLDWDKMQDSYGSNYTQESADAVAVLMKACGYSTAMGYSASTSGTLVGRISPALRNHFRIDVNCRVVARLPYTTQEWEEIVYNNLRDCGPMIYNGQSNLGGHSFVCDGYDGNGYFHFNWGWSGNSNGYFLLGALGPEVQGYGGFAGGFNFDQQIVAGIQRPTGDAKIEYPDQLAQSGSTTAVVSNGTLRFNVTDNSGKGWSNMTDHDFYMCIGALFEPLYEGAADALIQRGKYATLDVLHLAPSYYFSNNPMRIVVPLPDELPDGDYKVTPVTWPSEGDSSQYSDILCPPGEVNYVLLHVKDNEFTVSNVDPKLIEYSDLEVVTDIVSRKSAKLRFTATNNSDQSLSQCIAPVITTKGYLFKYVGTTTIVNLEPGESKDIECVARFFDPNGSECNVSGETNYIIYLYDPTNKKEYRDLKKEITIKPNDGSSRLSLNSMTIENAAKTKCEDHDSGLYGLEEYVVDNGENFNIQLNVNASGGLFDGRIELTSTNTITKESQILHASYPFFKQGTNHDFIAPLSHQTTDIGQHFRLKATYVINGYVYDLGNLYYTVKNVSGLESPQQSTAPAEIEYFNLQGVAVGRPIKGEIYIRVVGGKAEKVIF